VYGDWQIDTRPNINIDPRTQSQFQAPIYTSYGVIIPKTSSIALFEKAAEKERNEIPAEVQKGDALESTSKIKKAMKSVISNIAQNTNISVTSNDIMKKTSPWELTKLLERQMTNRAYEPSRYETSNYVNINPDAVNAATNQATAAKRKEAEEAERKKIADAEEVERKKIADAEEVERKKIADAEEAERKEATRKETEEIKRKEAEEIERKKTEAEELIKNVTEQNKNLLQEVNNDILEDEKDTIEEKADADEESVLAKDKTLLDTSAMLSSDESAIQSKQVKQITNIEKARQAIVEKRQRRQAAQEKRKQNILEKKRIIAENDAKTQMMINALPPDIRRYIEESWMNSKPKPLPLPTDINSRLHRQFENALIEATKTGFWNQTGFNKYIDIDNNAPNRNAIEQINLWKVSDDLTNTSLQNTILEIISQSTLSDIVDIVNSINNVFTTYPDESDEIKIVKCEIICDIKFVLIQQSTTSDKNTSSFEINQRVVVETTTDEKELVAGVNTPKKIMTPGIVVKVNQDNTYNVLTNDYALMERVGANNTRIQNADAFIIANLPTSETYTNENAMNVLSKLKKCAFILYDNSNQQQSTYRLIYKQNIRSNTSVLTSRTQKKDVYLFEFSSLPSYLYYMIFLASYKFSEPENDQLKGEFVLNEESPYPIIIELNNKRPNAKNPPISLDVLYNIYNKKLTDDSSSPTSSYKQYSFKMGGGDGSDGGLESNQQRGGGLEESFDAIKANDKDKLKNELTADVSLVNKKDNDGNTMLMFACQNAKLDIVKQLLDMGAQGTINDQNNLGNTALHIACQNNLELIARLLVLNGADLTIKNVLGKTPIDVCNDSNLKKQLELHLTNVKKVFELVKNNQINDLKDLLKTFRNLNIVDSANGNTPLHIACQLGNAEIAALLIQYGANPELLNTEGKTPFELIDNDTPRKELQSQYNKIKNLFKAVQNNSLVDAKNIIERLSDDKKKIIVNSRTNPLSDGTTPLILATRNKDINMIKYLLKSGANVNVGDKYDATPLHYACRNEDGEIAQILVNAGGDLAIKAIDSITPLDACKTNQLRIKLIQTYINNLAADNKLKMPKGLVIMPKDTDEKSIKKALEYYIKNPQKLESKNSYYVVIDLDLYPGTSISKTQKVRMQCASVWDNIQESWADARNREYVPSEMKLPLPVANATLTPIAKATPIANRSRRIKPRKRGGFTRRYAKQNQSKQKKSKRHKFTKRRYKTRRVKK
jgi:ankyrin repeat protein